MRVLFFAQLRELLGVSELTVEEPVADVEALRCLLAARGDKWALALDPDKLLVAVNHTLVSRDAPVHAGDEVAFFPPVTGG